MVSKKPPPQDLETDSDNDSDAPTALPNVSQKRAHHALQASLHEAEARRREKEKEVRREWDARIKRRALEKKQKGIVGRASKEDDGEGEDKQQDTEEEEDDDGETADTELEKRMKRAMAEAAEEDSEHEDVEMDGLPSGDSDIEDDDDDEEEFEEFGETIDMDGLDEDPDLDDLSEFDEAKVPPPKPSTKPSKITFSDPSTHLPDDLFTAAFSNTQPHPQSKAGSKAKAPKQTDNKKRKKLNRKRKPKDLLLGSNKKTQIQILPPSLGMPAIPKAVAPRAKVQKFITRNLGLAGEKKGWERRAANIGVLRSSTMGPAARFVRGAS